MGRRNTAPRQRDLPALDQRVDCRDHDQGQDGPEYDGFAFHAGAAQAGQGPCAGPGDRKSFQNGLGGRSEPVPADGFYEPVAARTSAEVATTRKRA